MKEGCGGGMNTERIITNSGPLFIKITEELFDDYMLIADQVFAENLWKSMSSQIGRNNSRAVEW
jgi:hypothetical protein